MIAGRHEEANAALPAFASWLANALFTQPSQRPSLPAIYPDSTAVKLAAKHFSPLPLPPCHIAGEPDSPANIRATNSATTDTKITIEVGRVTAQPWRHLQPCSQSLSASSFSWRLGNDGV